MRDIVVTLMILGTLPFILKRPYIGILVWSWLSYMNPHRLAWGFAYYQPFAQIVAITFFVSFFLHGEKIRLTKNLTTYLWIIFIVWMLITSLTAFYPELAFDYYIDLLKIQIFSLMTIVLIREMKQLNQLIVVIALSIGFYSIKGGVFTVLTAGAHRVWGPDKSFIADNNELAVATLMIIPLMYYLRHISKRQLVRNFWLFGIITSGISVLGSQSRGALIAIIAVALLFWIKSKGKFVSAIVLVLCSVLAYQFMPESWHERMQTTINYQEDASASSRLDSWQYNFNLANDNFTGGGFKKETLHTYDMYLPGTFKAYVAHSIYFSVLGDHGWFGLLIFVSILITTWSRLGKVSRLTARDAETHHLSLLAKMLQVSLIAYASGGAFLNLAYFDLPWHIVAIALVLEREVSQRSLMERREKPRPLGALS